MSGIVEQAIREHLMERAKLNVQKVIYNDPVTVVYWSNGEKTVVRCQPGDEFSPLIGFLMAVCKKSCGGGGNYNDLLRKFVPGYGQEAQNAAD